MLPGWGSAGPDDGPVGEERLAEVPSGWGNLHSGLSGSKGTGKWPYWVPLEDIRVVTSPTSSLLPFPKEDTKRALVQKGVSNWCGRQAGRIKWQGVLKK